MLGRIHTGTCLAEACARLLLCAFAATHLQGQAGEAVPSANHGPAPSDGNIPLPDQAPAGTGAAPGCAGNWQIDGTVYLWFSGAHGNLDAFGYNLGFKASARDLLSHFRFGVTGLGVVRYKRLVLTSDILYMALSNTKTRTLPLPLVPQISSGLLSRTVAFTQKVGFRMVENEKLKIDGLAGFRLWHLGQTLTVTPSPPANGNLYTSSNWVDPVMGARIGVPLSPKLVFAIGGDVGGWGVGSQLDYQIAGELNYRIKPNLSLGAGWRYLYLDYRANQLSTQLALSGPVVTMTYTFQRPN